MEYPRACEAQITYTGSGETELVRAGRREDALLYEITDMENAIASHTDKQEGMYLAYTRDVMELMTACRREWNFTYPEEECNE